MVLMLIIVIIWRIVIICVISSTTFSSLSLVKLRRATRLRRKMLSHVLAREWRIWREQGQNRRAVQVEHAQQLGGGQALAQGAGAEGAGLSRKKSASSGTTADLKKR